ADVEPTRTADETNRIGDIGFAAKVGREPGVSRFRRVLVQTRDKSALVASTAMNDECRRPRFTGGSKCVHRETGLVRDVAHRSGNDIVALRVAGGDGGTSPRRGLGK